MIKRKTETKVKLFSSEKNLYTRTHFYIEKIWKGRKLKDIKKTN